MDHELLGVVPEPILLDASRCFEVATATFRHGPQERDVRKGRSTRRWHGSLSLVPILLLSVTGCDDWLVVEDSSTFDDEEIRSPSSSTLLVNGAERGVREGWDAMLALLSTVSDELTWVGPHGWWGQLDRGDVASPGNVALERSYGPAAAATWYARESDAMDALYHEAVEEDAGCSGFGAGPPGPRTPHPPLHDRAASRRHVSFRHRVRDVGVGVGGSRATGHAVPDPHQ